MRCHRSLLFAVLATALVSNSHRALSANNAEEDRAIIAVVLQDFANWKDVTFGDLEGVLELDPLSGADPDASADSIRSWSNKISKQVGDDLIEAFIERNRSAVPIAPLISGSPWARLRQPRPKHAYPWDLPKGAKATGSLTLPGISADGARALILIRHSWSIHGAVVTCLLSKERGVWHIAAKDQAVFL